MILGINFKNSIIQRSIRKSGRVSRHLKMMAAYQYHKQLGALPKPVFIVCQNRTGSTFLNRLFGAHPQSWTYVEGPHQEAMRHRDCPNWLRGQAFLTRWQIYDTTTIERFQTRAWIACMARGMPFGVFKIPHAMTKMIPLQEIVHDIQFVLLIRHPYDQINSALATNNSSDYLKITADALIKLYKEQYAQIRNIRTIRYEDIINNPIEEFGGLCEALGMDNTDDVISGCISVDSQIKYTANF